jgi:hypothetical protein
MKFRLGCAIITLQINIAAALAAESIALRHCADGHSIELCQSSNIDVRLLISAPVTLLIDERLRKIAQPNDKVTCENIMKTHGFLSRAQFQCGFRAYSNDMMASAKKCSQGMSEHLIQELLKSGMETFDRVEHERGHEQICQDILADFPGIVHD